MEPRCPAARALAGPPALGPSVVCGVLAQERELADQVRHGTYSTGLITSRKDRSSYFGFCCGDGVPVEDLPEDGRAHYTGCPIWRARREADWAHQLEARKPLERHYPLGVGPTDDDLRDPNAAAHRAVEEMVRDA